VGPYKPAAQIRVAKAASPARLKLNATADQSRMIAAIFNLNHPAHTVHWHFIDLSVSNVIVIVLMLVVFVVAILAPFPRHREEQ